MMDGNLAVTYSLIYAFLKKQSQTKAADAVKKAARDVIILKDDLQLQGPYLDEIVKFWKESRAPVTPSESDSSDDSSNDSSTSSSSDSSSSSSELTPVSDDEESSSSESESEEGIQACAERETSATLSSDAKFSVVKTQAPPKKPSIKESSSSGSDTDNSIVEFAPDAKLSYRGISKKDHESLDSESSSSESASSSSSSESSSSESEPETTQISDDNPLKRTSKSRTSAGIASNLKEEMQVIKKRRTSESGAAVVTAAVPILPNNNTKVLIKHENKKSQGNNKPARNVNERFSRIKPQIIPPEHLLDNGYEAKGGTSNDYGNRAHRDLIITKGAGFRKEKNKKKRGSYRGGEITLQSHSIKFTD